MAYVSIICLSSMDNTFDFIMDMQRLTVEDRKVVSSLTTFTWWNFTLMKMLKKITCVLFDSTLCWCYLYFIYLRIPPSQTY
jgi:hypothetical protein